MEKISNEENKTFTFGVLQTNFVASETLIGKYNGINQQENLMR